MTDDGVRATSTKTKNGHGQRTRKTGTDTTENPLLTLAILLPSQGTI